MFTKKPMNMAAFENGGDQWGNRFGGNGFTDSLDTGKLKLERWKPAEGENLIDVIPFNASEENPLVISGKIGVGDTIYALDYFVHKSIGPSRKNITCLTQYGCDCPLCEEKKRLKNSSSAEDQKKAEKIGSKRRVVYVIHDLKTDKYGFWDTGWKSVEEKVQKLARVTKDSRTGAPINPFDWNCGATIKFYGEKKKFEGNDFVEPDLFSFIERDPLSDEVLEHSVDLATVIKKTTAEEMEQILAGKLVADKTESKSETPSAEKKSDAFKSVEAANVEDWDDNKSETSSLAEQALKAAEPEKAEPKEESKPSFDNMESVHKCPHGYNWGEADKHDECKKCKEFWDQCFDAGN